MLKTKFNYFILSSQKMHKQLKKKKFIELKNLVKLLTSFSQCNYAALDRSCRWTSRKPKFAIKSQVHRYVRYTRYNRHTYNMCYRS